MLAQVRLDAFGFPGGNMSKTVKLTMEKYQDTDQRRSFSAGDDADWYDVTVDRWRIKAGNKVLADDIEYEVWALKFITYWKPKNLKKLKAEHLKEFKKIQAAALKKFKASQSVWEHAQKQRDKLVTKGQKVPRELWNLSKLLVWKES
jgi:ABC-type taurine transport system substrate-binding protein